MAQITLNDSTNIAWDLATDFSAKLVATNGVGNTRNLLNSLLATAVEGETYQLIFKQDAIGNRQITFGSDFTVFGEFNLNPNAITIVSFVFDSDEVIVILTHGLEQTCDPIEVMIQGVIVYAIGKTNLTIFQDGDLFRYYSLNGYYVGKIIDATGIVFPDDLETNKIQLLYNG